MTRRLIKTNLFTGLLVCLPGLFLCSKGFAGTFIFAGESNGVDVVAHPTSYTGQGGTLTVRVCIAPSSANATAMEIPVQNNINIYNRLQPTTGNLVSGGNNNIPSGQLDFESVALHELGHCIGLAHVNAASESGLTGNNKNYTKATNGSNNQFDINPGADGVIGSNDDIRGDDVNLHWYRKSNNNPFTIDTTVDSNTYARDLSDLPTGHSFATNADRTVASNSGYPGTESVMQQLTFFDEAQRTLTHDDVATLLYAASGKNEVAGNNDDYTINLEYGGISNSNCDINLKFDNSQTGFAVCQTGGAFLPGSDHIRITSANIFFNTGFNWFFNTDTANQAVDTDNDGLSDATEAVLGTDPNNADTDGDGLADGAGGIVPLAALPGGVDTDGDGFVDGEQDFGTDPLASNAGDVAPRGAPDNVLNAGDAVVLTRLVTGIITADALETVLADLNNDSQINAADLLLLQQLLLATP
jgi:hypothetical protein